MQTAVLKWVIGHDFISTAIPGYTTFDQNERGVVLRLNINAVQNRRSGLACLGNQETPRFSDKALAAEARIARPSGILEAIQKSGFF